MRGFNFKKSVQALVFFANQSGGLLNKMKGIKLVWLADRYHLRQYGRTITGDVYFALPYGPIPSTTRDLLEQTTFSDIEREYAQQYIEPLEDYDFKVVREISTKVFSETDLNVLYLIQKHYGHLNHFQLSDLSHSYPEWAKYKAAFEAKQASRFQIDLELFFTNVKDGYGLFEDSEESIAITKKMYQFHSNVFID